MGLCRPRPPSASNRLILQNLFRREKEKTIWRGGCYFPWHRANSQKRRNEVYERISGISQHHATLGWIGSSGVGRCFAARSGGKLECAESGQERRAIDTSHREAGQ